MSVIENKNGRSNEPIRCKKKIQKIDNNNKIHLKMKICLTNWVAKNKNALYNNKINLKMKMCLTNWVTKNTNHLL